MLEEPLLESEQNGGEIVEAGTSSPEPFFKALAPAPTMSPEERRRDTIRKVKIAVAVFSGFTAIFIIIAIAARNIDPKQYGPPKCADCEVIGSVASNVAQGILPIVYLTALWASWYKEKPRRSLRQFAVDNLKQLVSGAITHFEATAFAILMRDSVYEGEVSECDWYLILFMLDTAYGCFLTVGLHAITVRYAKGISWAEPLSRLGDYYGKPREDGSRPPSTSSQMVWRWIAQTLHWTVIAVIMRGVVVGWAYLFRRSVGKSAVLLGSWACDRSQQDGKAFLNIVFFPIIMDSIQVTVQSFALKPDVMQLPNASVSKKDRPIPLGADISVSHFTDS